MTGPLRRRAAIGTDDPIWAGAVAAALAGIGIEVGAVVSDPLGIPQVGVSVVIAYFNDVGLRDAVTIVDVPAGVLAVGPDDIDLMVELLEAGALGYLTSDSSFSEISKAVDQLLGGHAVVPPAALGTLLRRVVERRRGRSADMTALESLTPREREVFEQAARGSDNASIAAHLYISPATARTHLQRVFKKLGVHSKAEAMAFASRCGLDIQRATE